MIVGLVCLKSIGADQQVEIQVKTDVAILCLKFAEQAGGCFCAAVLKQNCFFLWKLVFAFSQSFPLLG